MAFAADGGRLMDARTDLSLCRVRVVTVVVFFCFFFSWHVVGCLQKEWLDKDDENIAVVHCKVTMQRISHLFGHG